MSELNVIVIHIRGEQAAEYERLFDECELRCARHPSVASRGSSTPMTTGTIRIALSGPVTQSRSPTPVGW